MNFPTSRTPPGCRKRPFVFFRAMEKLRRSYCFLRTVQTDFSGSLLQYLLGRKATKEDISAHFDVFIREYHRDVVFYLRGNGSFLLDLLLAWYQEEKTDMDEFALYPGMEAEYPEVAKEEVLWGLRVFAQVPSLMTLERCHNLWSEMTRRKRDGTVENHMYNKWREGSSTHPGVDGVGAQGQIMTFLHRMSPNNHERLFTLLLFLAEAFKSESEEEDGDSEMLDLTDEDEGSGEVIDLTDEEE